MRETAGNPLLFTGLNEGTEQGLFEGFAYVSFIEGTEQGLYEGFANASLNEVMEIGLMKAS